MFRDNTAVGEKTAQPPKRKVRLRALSEEEVRLGLLALARIAERQNQVPEKSVTDQDLRDLQRQYDLLGVLRLLYEGWKKGVSHQAIINSVRNTFGNDEATARSEVDFLLRRYPALILPVKEAAAPKQIRKENLVPRKHRQPIRDAFARCANDEEMAKELGFSPRTITVYRYYLGLKRPRANLLKKTETMPAQEETDLADRLEAKNDGYLLHPAP